MNEGKRTMAVKAKQIGEYATEAEYAASWKEWGNCSFVDPRSGMKRKGYVERTLQDEQGRWLAEVHFMDGGGGKCLNVPIAGVKKATRRG